jgi:putative ABC transport system substrate-binding protein
MQTSIPRRRKRRAPSRSKDFQREAGVGVSRQLPGALIGYNSLQQSTNVEPAMNLKTAKALGIEVPPALLAIADEVIE